MPYTAIVLDKASRQKLIEIALCAPKKWERIAHHCTLHMGAHEPTDPPLGERIKLVADAWGAREGRVLAARVSQGGEHSRNAVPHITVAVNREIGAKPFESNQIEFWYTCPPIDLVGFVEECD